MSAPLAAIVYPAGFPIETLLAQVAGGLRREAVRLGGVVQHNAVACGNGCAGMLLEGLASGRLFPIREDRGVGAPGSRLDASGLAAAGTDGDAAPARLMVALAALGGCCSRKRARR